MLVVMLLIGGNKTDKGEVVIVIMAVLIDGDCHMVAYSINKHIYY